MNSRHVRTNAFTLVEIFIVIVIVSIIASFGIPSYTKSIGRARARDAINNISIIHAANVIYNVRMGVNVTAVDLAGINAALQLNVISTGGTSYACSGGECVATAAGGASDFEVTGVLDDPLSGTNPTCSGSQCP